MIPPAHQKRLKDSDPAEGDTWSHKFSGLRYRVRGLAVGQSSKEEAKAQVREISTKVKEGRFCEQRILVLYERNGYYFARPLDEFVSRFEHRE